MAKSSAQGSTITGTPLLPSKHLWARNKVGDAHIRPGARLGGQPLLNRAEAALKVGRRDVDVLRDPLGVCVHDR